MSTKKTEKDNQLFFVDTSTLYRALNEGESGHEKALKAINDVTVILPTLARIEYLSVLFRKYSQRKKANRLKSFFESVLKQSFVTVLHFDNHVKIFKEARRLIETHKMKTLDSLILAQANLLKKDTDYQIIFVSSDKNLFQSAEKEGLKSVFVGIN